MERTAYKTTHEMRSLVWQQRVGYVDSTFLDSEQGPGEAIHTTSFSLHLAPLEFSVIRYNAGGGREISRAVSY